MGIDGETKREKINLSIISAMKIHNKSNFWVGLVLLVIPNWFPEYQNIYKYLIQLAGFILIVLAFIKFKKSKKKSQSVN